MMMVRKTHLKKGGSISFRGFQVFRKYRESPGGGVAVLVGNDLQVRQVELDSPIEAVEIEVKILRKRRRFVSVYIPPSRS